MRAIGNAVLLAVAVLTVSESASADLVLTLSPEKTTYLPGETGTLDVFLTASSGSTEEVVGYNLDITATSGATFGGDGSVTGGPSPYLFTATSSGIEMSSSAGDQTVSYSDESNDLDVATPVTSSTLFGVGQILFTVSPTAVPGSEITFSVDPFTTFASSELTSIPYSSTPTTITVAAVPEPSSLALLGLTGAGALVWRRRRARSSADAGTA